MFASHLLLQDRSEAVWTMTRFFLFPGLRIWGRYVAEQMRRIHLPFITADVKDILLCQHQRCGESAKAHPNALFWLPPECRQEWLNRPIMSAPQQVL